MNPFEHTLDSVNKIAVHGWNVRGSVTCDDIIVVLLVWKALQTRASVNISFTAYPVHSTTLLTTLCASSTQLLTHCLPYSMLNSPSKICGDTLP